MITIVPGRYALENTHRLRPFHSIRHNHRRYAALIAIPRTFEVKATWTPVATTGKLRTELTEIPAPLIGSIDPIVIIRINLHYVRLMRNPMITKMKSVTNSFTVWKLLCTTRKFNFLQKQEVARFEDDMVGPQFRWFNTKLSACS